jgi:hypothetical protein
VVNLQDIIKTLDLTVLTQPQDFSNLVPQGGYASDLLSCVMAGACHQGVWVTLQAHGNIVAVAALLDLAAIIITEDAMPEETTIARANAEGIALLCTSQPSFAVVGRLWELGLRTGS